MNASLPVKRPRLLARLTLALLAGLVAGVQAQPTVEQSEARIVPIDATLRHEHYTPMVDVSGSTLKGVMAEPGGDPNRESDDQHLYVTLPPEVEIEGKRLCLTLSSRDGQYNGQLEVPLDGATGLSSPRTDYVQIRADFTSRQPDYYHEYERIPAPYRLAALAELKADCDPATLREAVLVVGWQPRPGDALPPQRLSILVNANRLETLLAVWVKGETAERELGIPCIPLDVSPRIAYDTVCELAPGRLEAQVGTLLLEQDHDPVIIRQRGGNVAGTLALELRL